MSVFRLSGTLDPEGYSMVAYACIRPIPQQWPPFVWPSYVCLRRVTSVNFVLLSQDIGAFTCLSACSVCPIICTDETVSNESLQYSTGAELLLIL